MKVRRLSKGWPLFSLEVASKQRLSPSVPAWAAVQLYCIHVCLPSLHWSSPWHVDLTSHQKCTPCSGLGAAPSWLSEPALPPWALLAQVPTVAPGPQGAAGMHFILYTCTFNTIKRIDIIVCLSVTGYLKKPSILPVHWILHSNKETDVTHTLREKLTVVLECCVWFLEVAVPNQLHFPHTF